jgi:hypothetical protein
VLDLWIEQTECGKCGLRVVNALNAGSVNDILIAAALIT